LLIAEFQIARATSAKHIGQNGDGGGMIDNSAIGSDMSKVLIKAQDLESLETLGRGSYGEVVKGRYR